MGRKCSHCSHIGHNARTCTTTYSYGSCRGCRRTSAAGPSSHEYVFPSHRAGLRLFGVQLSHDLSSASNSSSSASAASSSNHFMKKSFSMESFSTSIRRPIDETFVERADTSFEYLSDGLVPQQERKKGVAWTEEEHMAFLTGLEKLGKGDWRGISRTYVTTRTPTQVASHAQKYFLHISTLSKKKHQRSSLFDMTGSQAHNSRSFQHQNSMTSSSFNNHDLLSCPSAALPQKDVDLNFDAQSVSNHCQLDHTADDATMSATKLVGFSHFSADQSSNYSGAVTNDDLELTLGM